MFARKNIIPAAIKRTARRLKSAKLSYGHGTDNAFDEAAFIVLESLGLPPDADMAALAGRTLTSREYEKIEAVIAARIATRKPVPYLLNKAYMHGVPFYVDERVLVPRSFIGDLLCAEDGFYLLNDEPRAILDLCTGSGCLAVLAAMVFPLARVDAVDLSPAALAVAARNVADHNLGDRLSLYEGNLFAPVAGKTYDLIIANPPYVDAAGMTALPPEYRQEPALALAAGEDGLDLVRRIINEAPAYINKGGGLLCEIGRGQAPLEEAFPSLDLLWLETPGSTDEVFWLKF